MTRGKGEKAGYPEPEKAELVQVAGPGALHTFPALPSWSPVTHHLEIRKLPTGI